MPEFALGGLGPNPRCCRFPGCWSTTNCTVSDATNDSRASKVNATIDPNALQGKPGDRSAADRGMFTPELRLPEWRQIYHKADPPPLWHKQGGEGQRVLVAGSSFRGN